MKQKLDKRTNSKSSIVELQFKMDAPEGICPKCLMGSGFAGEMAQIVENHGSVAKLSIVPPKPKELAKHFSDIEILELLGQGGMGAVYQARHMRHDRIVALTILPLEFSTDLVLTERFLREARVMAKISHPIMVLIGNVLSAF